MQAENKELLKKVIVQDIGQGILLLLKIVIPKSTFYDDCIMLSGRYTNLSYNYSNNAISFDNKSIEEGKIRLSIINIINSLSEEDVFLDHIDEILLDKNSSLLSKDGILIDYLHSIGLVKSSIDKIENDADSVNQNFAKAGERMQKLRELNIDFYDNVEYYVEISKDLEKELLKNFSDIKEEVSILYGKLRNEQNLFQKIKKEIEKKAVDTEKNTKLITKISSYYETEFDMEEVNSLYENLEEIYVLTYKSEEFDFFINYKEDNLFLKEIQKLLVKIINFNFIVYNCLKEYLPVIISRHDFFVEKE